jgi:hypothetical protein
MLQARESVWTWRGHCDSIRSSGFNACGAIGEINDQVFVLELGLAVNDLTGQGAAVVTTQAVLLFGRQVLAAEPKFRPVLSQETPLFAPILSLLCKF